MANSKKKAKKKYTIADYFLYGFDAVLFLAFAGTYIVYESLLGVALSLLMLLVLIATSKYVRGYTFVKGLLSFHIIIFLTGSYVCLIPILLQFERGVLAVICLTTFLVIGTLLTQWDKIVVWWSTR